MAAVIEENLISWLLADSTIGNAVGSRVFDNQLANDKGDFIFVQQEDSGYEDCLDDSSGGQPFRRFYSVECWSEDLSRARVLGQRVQAYAHLYTGTFGDTTVKRIFAASQSEDYQPKADGSSDSFHGVFLRLEVIP